LVFEVAVFSYVFATCQFSWQIFLVCSDGFYVTGGVWLWEFDSVLRSKEDHHVARSRARYFTTARDGCFMAHSSDFNVQTLPQVHLNIKHYHRCIFMHVIKTGDMK